MAVSRITPPVSRPVSLNDVKLHLRIETNDDDGYIDNLIDAAVVHLELVSGLKLITQTWRQYLDVRPPSGMIRLGVGPVREIIAARYFDANGVAQTINPLNMLVDAISTPARLLISGGLPVGQSLNGIEIDIVTGYGDSATEVPDSLRRALLLLVAHNYEFRGAVPVGQMPASEPHGFRTLIAPFRKINL